LLGAEQDASTLVQLILRLIILQAHDDMFSLVNITAHVQNMVGGGFEDSDCLLDAFVLYDVGHCSWAGKVPANTSRLEIIVINEFTTLEQINTITITS
jgi:hypothetical protein